MAERRSRSPERCQEKVVGWLLGLGLGGFGFGWFWFWVCVVLVLVVLVLGVCVVLAQANSADQNESTISRFSQGSRFIFRQVPGFSLCVDRRIVPIPHLRS